MMLKNNNKKKLKINFTGNKFINVVVLWVYKIFDFLIHRLHNLCILPDDMLICWRVHCTFDTTITQVMFKVSGNLYDAVLLMTHVPLLPAIRISKLKCSITIHNYLWFIAGHSNCNLWWRFCIRNNSGINGTAHHCVIFIGKTDLFDG